MKKSLLIIVTFVFVILLAGCFDVGEVDTIEFTKSPSASYILNQKVSAKDFEVKVKTESQTFYFDLTNPELVVQGLSGKNLDTSSAGFKTLKVTYKTVSVSFQYEVKDTTPLASWQGEPEVMTATIAYLGSEVNGVFNIDTALKLAVVAKLVNSGTDFLGKTIKLSADINLGGKLWVPIGSDSKQFKGNFDGDGKTINNIVITQTESTPSTNHAGLFGYVSGGTTGAPLVFKNVKLDKVEVIMNSPFGGENAKNVSALIGYSSAILNISNIEVTNAELKGNGRVGSIIGVSHKPIIIKDCKVNATLSAHNPIFLTYADGEGDKVGGLVGQAQEEATYENNEVTVLLNGTRDIGGIVGYQSKKAVFKNNTVNRTSILQVTAVGGFEQTKGSCNVGGLVGTIQGSMIVQFEANKVLTSNIIADNSGESSLGVLFGGIRKNIPSANYQIINVDKNQTYTFTADQKNASFAEFLVWQSNIVKDYSN